MGQEGSLSEPVDLSVVIPLYNAEATLARVVGDFVALGRAGLSCQIILVDDASADGSSALARRLAAEHPTITALAHERNRGAGIARMTGWSHAQGRYTLFFDADDVLHGEALLHAVALLETHPEADTAMLAYRYERGAANTGIEMSWQDTGIYRRLLAGGVPAVGTPEEMADLLLVANYPWNKVIRTAHFRRAGLRFGTTLVNNDVRGHWEMILKARRIVLSDAVICTHLVDRGGGNVTNRFGEERLQMLTALSELYDWLEARPALRAREAHRFWELARRLVLWARERLDPALQARLDAGWSDLVARIDLGDFLEMREGRAPRLADALANALLR